MLVSRSFTNSIANLGPDRLMFQVWNPGDRRQLTQTCMTSRASIRKFPSSLFFFKIKRKTLVSLVLKMTMTLIYSLRECFSFSLKEN